MATESLDYKLVCVIIDDFSSRSISEFSNYNITYYDYAASYTQYGVDEFWSNGYNSYDFGDIDYVGNLGDHEYGWYNLDDLDSLSYSFSTDPIIQEYYDPDYYYFNRYYTYSYFDALDPVTSWTQADPTHGDWVLKAFTDQLDAPDEVEVIAIDLDYGNDYLSLFESILVDGKTLPSLYSIINDAFGDLYNSSYQYLMQGISCSFTDTFPNTVNASLIQNLISEDWFVVQSAPNVTSSGVDWGTFVDNVINVGAWNTDENLYALAANQSALGTVDIYADGYVERSGWGSGWNFGTSFATPRVFAEIANLFTETVLPRLESGEITVDSGINLTSDQETDVTNAVIDALSDTYTVFLDDDITSVGEVSVSKATIAANGVTPLAIPASISNFGYTVTGVNKSVITEEILVKPQDWRSIEFESAEADSIDFVGTELVVYYTNGYEVRFGFDRSVETQLVGNLIYLDVYDDSTVKVAHTEGFSFYIENNEDFLLVADRISQLDTQTTLTSDNDLYDFDPDGSLVSDYEEVVNNGIIPGKTLLIDGGEGVDTLYSTTWGLADFEFSLNESGNIVSNFIHTNAAPEIRNFEYFQLSDTPLLSYQELHDWILDPNTNYAPKAFDVTITGLTEDTNFSNSLTSGFDINGDSLTFKVVDNPSHGTLVLSGDGNFAYTPDANFNGDDSFTYTVNDGELTSEIQTISLNVTAVNDVPEASSLSFRARVNATLSNNLPQGMDVDNDELTYQKVTDPSYGSLVVNEDGSFTYTPNTDFEGNDSFSYLVSDGVTDSNVATVSLNISSSSTGQIYEWHTHKALTQVSIQSKNNNFDSSSSDSAGDFQLSGIMVTGEELTIALDALSDTELSLTFEDAYAALQLAGGVNPNDNEEPISPYQYYAADIDQSGDLTFDDAYAVLMLAGGATNNHEWLFFDEKAALWDFDSDSGVPDSNNIDWSIPSKVFDDETGEVNFVGVLKGDVLPTWDSNSSALSDSYFTDLDTRQIGSTEQWWV